MPIVVDETQYDRYTTATVRRQLGIPLRTRRLGGPDGAEVESYRVLRLITTQRLAPLTRLSGDVFIDAWFQCAEVHYLNWMNGIHHQDLSLDNLMYRTRGDTIYAVLNDWDLAIDTTLPQTHTGLEMTGTVPFMAIHRLIPAALRGEVQHLYRHDLESLFYILLWALSCYEDGKRLDSLPETFASWIKDDMNRCARDKYWLLAWEYWPNDIKQKESWGKLGPKLLDVLRKYFCNILVTRKGLVDEWNTTRFMAMPSDDIQSHRPPTEDDAPSKFWEEFCALIKWSIASVLTDDPQLHAELSSRLLSLVDS
ncbi:hypothetical protein C2E23DRAFT_778774 [Lenzites betulinus]|nr:hypothetical protein C2E23DRAFT_778774 [Lenzites betulinus]